MEIRKELKFGDMVKIEYFLDIDFKFAFFITMCKNECILGINPFKICGCTFYEKYRYIPANYIKKASKSEIMLYQMEK
jgi:hypothetical protein